MPKLFTCLTQRSDSNTGQIGYFTLLPILRKAFSTILKAILGYFIHTFLFYNADILRGEQIGCSIVRLTKRGLHLPDFFNHLTKAG
jgi:hypothetical protein